MFNEYTHILFELLWSFLTTSLSFVNNLLQEIVVWCKKLIVIAFARVTLENRLSSSDATRVKNMQS